MGTRIPAAQRVNPTLRAGTRKIGGVFPLHRFTSPCCYCLLSACAVYLTRYSSGTFAAAHGLQGLHAFAAAHGLQGLHAFAAEHGLQGLQAFAAEHGLQGLHAFAAEHGLQGLQAFAAAHGLLALAAAHGLQGLHAFAAAQGLQAALAAAQGLQAEMAMRGSLTVPMATTPAARPSVIGSAAALLIRLDLKDIIGFLLEDAGATLRHCNARN